MRAGGAAGRVKLMVCVGDAAAFQCVCVNVFKLNRFVTVDKNLSNPINCKWSSIKPRLS